MRGSSISSLPRHSITFPQASFSKVNAFLRIWDHELSQGIHPIHPHPPFSPQTLGALREEPWNGEQMRDSRSSGGELGAQRWGKFQESWPPGPPASDLGVYRPRLAGFINVSAGAASLRAAEVTKIVVPQTHAPISQGSSKWMGEDRGDTELHPPNTVEPERTSLTACISSPDSHVSSSVLRVCGGEGKYKIRSDSTSILQWLLVLNSFLYFDRLSIPVALFWWTPVLCPLVGPG